MKALVLAAVLAIGAIDPSSLLRLSCLNEDELALHGVKETLIRTKRGRVEMRVEVWQEGGRRSQRFLAGPLAGDRIVEIGGRVFHISPKSKTVKVNYPLPFPKRFIDLIFRNYDVRAVGEEEVAGRRTTILELRPLHSGNPSRRIWVDLERAFPLRAELYSPDGGMISAYRFLEVEFDPGMDESAFEIPKGWRLIERPGFRPVKPDEDLRRLLGFEPIPLRSPPPGYVLLDMLISTAPPRPILQIRYTDGLNLISVFQRPRPPRMMREWSRMRRWRRGPRGYMMIAPHPRLLISVAGDVSEELLRRVIEENFLPRGMGPPRR